MIYQCYFKPTQVSSLFSEDCYTGFGLEPECNKDLFLNCPELMDQSTRLALTEYACFLWFWRNQDAIQDDWFGTTSYRQLDKQKFKFKNKNQINNLLLSHKDTIITWGLSEFYEANGYPLPIAIQTEIAHPHMTSYINESFKTHKIDIPIDWFTQPIGILGNYWLMQKEMFFQFMEFSWPLVKSALLNKAHPYFNTEMKFGCDKKKAVGYYMERLFILWCQNNQYNIHSVCHSNKLKSPISIYA